VFAVRTAQRRKDVATVLIEADGALYLRSQGVRRMGDLAYTVMGVAVFVGLALLLRAVQWCSDATWERRNRSENGVRRDR
jgi:hypothetical protein